MLKLSKAECSIVIDTTPVAITQKQMPNSIGYAVLYVCMYVCLYALRLVSPYIHKYEMCICVPLK